MSSPSRLNSSRINNLILMFTVAVLTTAAAVLLFESFVSFDATSAIVRTWTGGQLSRSGYQRITLCMRLLSLGLIGAASLLYWQRRRVRLLLEQCASESRWFAVTAKARVREFRKEDPLHLLALGLVGAAALAIRFVYLWQPMQYDEAFAFDYYASQPFYVGLSLYFEPNNHVLHTLLVHVAYRVFGNHPWALRLPALIAGLMLIPISYVTLRTFYNKHAALLMTALIAPSALLVEYSTNARGYSTVVLCFLLMLWIGSEILSGEHWLPWAFFVSVGAMGFFTIPIMLYPFGIVVGWMLVSRLGRGGRGVGRFVVNLLLALLVILFVVFLLYLPIVIVSGAKALLANRFVSALPWREFTGRLPGSLIHTWRGWNANIPPPIPVVLLLGSLLALVFGVRSSKFTVPIVAVSSLWLSAVLVFQRVVPFERVWLFLLPLYFAVASAGLTVVVNWCAHRMSISEPRTIAALAVLLCATSTVGLLTGNFIDKWNFTAGTESVAQFLEAEFRPGDKLFVPPPTSIVLEYYFRKHRVSDGSFFAPIVAGQRMIVVVPKVRRMDRVVESSDELNEHILWEWNGPTEPQRISQWLEIRLKAGDRVLATQPLDLGLDYYLREHDASDSYGFATLAPSQRLILLIAKPCFCPAQVGYGRVQLPILEDAVNPSSTAEFELSTPRLLKQFDKSTVYECRVLNVRESTPEPHTLLAR